MDNFLNNKELMYFNHALAEMHDNDNYEKAFNTFLERLKELIQFEKGDIYFYKRNQNQIEFRDFIFVDWGEQDLKSYLDEYYGIDDVLPIISNEQPMMFKSSDVFIAAERKKTRYYNELLNPAGMEHSIEGNLYVRDDGFVSGIGIHRSDQYEDFSQRDLEILKMSRPHLASVARKFQSDKEDLSSCILETSLLSNIQGLGICIWDYDLKLLECNFEQNPTIKAEHIQELMRTLITLCKSIRGKIASTAKLMLDPEDLRARSRISIGSSVYFSEVVFAAGGKPAQGKFIATIYDYHNLFQNILNEIKERFALTEREMEVMRCAFKGMSNSEISKELFISVPTVKKHLTNIYNKMDIEGKHQMLSTILE